MPKPECSACEGLMAAAERADKKKVVGVVIGLGILAGVVYLATRKS